MVVAMALLGVLVVVVALLYNSLVRARNRVDEGWAQVEVQLQRRHDLIPNLVETVKGYAAHEREVLAAVTEARSAALRAERPRELATAEEQLDARLKTLFAVAEGYPDLQASANFLELQRELTTTEDRIAYSRQFYNSAVRRYDDRRQTLPTSLVASLMAFGDREYYDPDPGVGAVPDVAW